MRKLFFLLVALFATTCLWAYHFQSGDLCYNITSGTTVEVTYQDKSSSNNYAGLTTATIPDIVTHNGTTYSVTSIGERAFQSCSTLTSLTLPNSVTSIGNYAFYNCSSLTSITIPNNVTSIGNYAFSGCSSLTSVTIGNSVTSIGDQAFDNCSSLTSVTIPNSVESIGWRAFQSCISLISITIPNSVTTIGTYAFDGCSALTSMIVENGNTIYDSRENCNAIIETATNTLLSGCQNTIIPNSVTSIESSAFSGCSSLTSIIIPNSVTSIVNNPFEGCYGLSSIVVESGNHTYDSRENCNAIIETKSNTLIAGCQNTVIPNSVTSIGNWAFSGCSSLTSITIPDGVKSIGNCAFKGCSSLSSFTIPNSVMRIEGQTFENCSSLTSVTIPNSVTSIGSSAFSGCSSLTSITIPNSVTSIGHDAFSSTGIYSNESNWENDVLYISNCLIEAKDNISGSYTIKDNTRLLADKAFNGCSSLTSIVIPNSVTSIGSQTFSSTGIYSNESNWENDVLYISNCLIEAKDNISSSYTIKDNTRLLADQAFNGCSSLTSITIPNSVTSIGINAFRVCSSFTTITIPNSVTSIGNWAFDGCSSLNTIYVEATTPSTLGYNVFTNTPSPACYIPCGTLTAYEASDWAEQVGGFVEQCDNNNDEQSSVSVTDGTAADWNNLPVEYLFETQCAEGSSWNALKSVKVYADSTYINLVVEWDTEIVTDLSSVPFQVYLNVDNDAPTGGFSDLWIKPNIDLLLEGNFYLDGFPCAYQPVVALYAGTPLANEWAWDLISIESVAANQLITKGVMEIQIDYGKLPVKLENTFTVGFSIQQSWTPVGVLPNAANDNTGNRVLAEKMLVRINNVNVSTPVENTELNSSNVQKIFRDGQVLILRDGKIYSVMGQEL